MEEKLYWGLGPRWIPLLTCAVSWEFLTVQCVK